MNVDQHLHRAAHRLRELDVETPDFVPGPSATRRYGPGIMAGLLLVGGTATVMTQPPATAEPEATPVEQVQPVAEVAVTTGEVESADPAPPTFAMTVQEELALIREISASDGVGAEPAELDFRIPDGAS